MKQFVDASLVSLCEETSSLPRSLRVNWRRGWGRNGGVKKGFRGCRDAENSFETAEIISIPLLYLAVSIVSLLVIYSWLDSSETADDSYAADVCGFGFFLSFVSANFPMRQSWSHSDDEDKRLSVMMINGESFEAFPIDVLLCAVLCHLPWGAKLTHILSAAPHIVRLRLVNNWLKVI